MAEAMHYVRLLRVFFGIGLQSELAYRGNFLLQLFETAVQLATGLGGLAIIFSHTRTLAGWRAEEMVMLLGVYFITAGFIGMVVQPSTNRLMQDVREGTLDFVLTKPASSQFLVSFREVAIWRAADVGLGGALMLAAAARLGADVGADHVLLFVAALAAGGVIVYSFRMILATVTFWLVRIENIMVIWRALYEAGKFPLDMYPNWLRAVLTFLVPVAFATTVPAAALAGRMNVTSVAGALALAAALLVAASAFWRYGLRHYTGASA